MKPRNVLLILGGGTLLRTRARTPATAGRCASGELTQNGGVTMAS